MAVNNFNSLLRSICSSCYNEGKEVKKVEAVAGYALSGQAQGLLVSLVRLCMATDYFKPDTKEYLSNKYRSIRTVIGVDGCASNKHTSRSRINYDLSKLRAVLGEDSLNVIVKQPNADLTNYISKVNELNKRYERKSLLDGFYIKTRSGEEMKTEVSEDDFNILMEIVKYGSKKGKMLMESNLTPEFIGYIKYLEQYEELLEDKEKERYNTLSAWLRG